MSFKCSIDLLRSRYRNGCHLNQSSEYQKHVLTNRSWIRVVFVIEAIISLGPLFALWLVGCFFVITTSLSNPYNPRMLWHHLGFWSVILAGGYGLFSAIFMGCWLNDYANAGLPVWMKTGLAVGLFLFLFYIVGCASDNFYIPFLLLIIPTPWTFTFTCLWRIHRFSKGRKDVGSWNAAK